MSIVDVLPLDLLDSMRTTKNPSKRNNLFERKKKNVTFYKPALQQLKVTSDYLTMLVRASVPPKDTERDGRTARAFTSRKERGQQVGAIIAITREDMENLLISSSRNGNSSRLGWSPGCQCPCHMAAASVSVYPKVASFSTTGGTSQHMITNQSKNRIAVKIKCSDNHLYKVSPVYCFLDPGYTQQLDIARGDGLKKKDKLVLMFLETTAAAEDAKIVFEVCASRPVSIALPLNVTEE